MCVWGGGGVQGVLSTIFDDWLIFSILVSVSTRNEKYGRLRRWPHCTAFFISRNCNIIQLIGKSKSDACAQN